MSLYQDPHWPRASAWLAGDSAANPIGRLAIVGAPVAKGSITPGRCDLAPSAIRKALERFSTYDCNTRGEVRKLLSRDVGDLEVAALTPEQACQSIRDTVSANLETAEAVVLLGGDNSITRPGCLGLGAPLDRCGLLTLDAHFDLRDLEGGLTNGNPVRALLHRDGLPGNQVFQLGIQAFANSGVYARAARANGTHTITADCVHERGITTVVREALDDLNTRTDRIYVDLDLDVLDRIYAPATPGARPGGLAPHEIRRAAFLCGAHPKVRVLDLVEIDPTRDIADTTVLTAAACLLEFASGLLERFSRE
jgi:formimidoylglutamase